ncbi:MAG TPA: hypothetical protein VF530_17285 [Planctomycetota bacterium]
MKRVLLAIAAVAALFLGVRGLVRHLAPDEVKIRRLVAAMEAAYNEGDPSGCVAPLARDWRHAGSEIDRRMLLGALFQTARDREKETRQLRSRVEVDEEAARVAVDGERATLTLEAVFARLRGGEWSETWRARIEAELVEGDDGWEIVQSRHEDLTGTHLGR